MTRVSSSPFLRAPTTIGRVMRDVMLALIPGYIACLWFFGWGIVIQALLAVATALACEAMVMRLRRRSISAALFDGSATITALLLALSIPSLAPWWIIVLGTAFAVLVLKHVYGGLGQNLFNPAMGGYVMLLISFPLEMTQWTLPHSMLSEAPGLATSAGLILAGASGLDALTGATTLDTLKTGLGMMLTTTEISSSGLFGTVGGTGWEWIATGFGCGGMWLLWRGVISWHIPFAMLCAIFMLALLVHVSDPDASGSPMLHLFSGSAIVGAFFIATDPVSAPATVRGKLLYGAGIGLLTYIIRVWGGYPEGVAFAVLLMNATAPSIEYYTRSRVFGH